MPLTVTFTNDAFPPGTEFSLDGVGVLKNGEATVLTEEQEREFASTNRVLVQDHLKDSEHYKVEGSPTVTSVEQVLGSVSVPIVKTETETPTLEVTADKPQEGGE